MPIRINLLAEAQSAEELRRRDPVKRVIVAGLLSVALMAAWSSYVQLKVMLAGRELGAAQFQLDSHKTDYDTAITNNAKIATIKLKISALKKMSNSRMLQGNLLDALQKINVDNVQLTRVKVDQAYVASPVPRGQISKTVTEKVSVTLNARDSSSNPGDQVGKFMQALSRQVYFRDALNKTNGVVLTDESPAQQEINGGGNFVLFTLECHFPDQKR